MGDVKAGGERRRNVSDERSTDGRNRRNFRRRVPARPKPDKLWDALWATGPPEGEEEEEARPSRPAPRLQHAIIWEGSL